MYVPNPENRNCGEGDCIKQLLQKIKNSKGEFTLDTHVYITTHSRF